MKSQVTYVEENATHDWLCFLSKQPGEVWVEIQDGGLVLIHEFEELDERSTDEKGHDLH